MESLEPRLLLSAATQLAFVQQPASSTTATALNTVKVGVEDSSGQMVTGDSSVITLTLNGGSFISGQNTATVAATNGLGAFSGLEIDTPGTYTLTASDGSLRSATSMQFQIFQFHALASLASTGQYPYGGITIDAMGDLFGTTEQGGDTGVGSVFEIAKGSSSVVTLASFTTSDGAYPQSGLTIDGNGNLFGTTTQGGSANVGTVFEIPAGTQTIETIANFNKTNGSIPIGGVVLDPAGDVFGSTTAGGANNEGTVYEIAAGSTTITTLASFNGINGASPQSGVIIDSMGDLFGTTSSGSGTLFELPAGSGTIHTLATLDRSANGFDPYGSLAMDSKGNLFGTTVQGGPGGNGCVFELANGASAITTLASFDGIRGANPYGALLLDPAGNLWGTTNSGGAAGQGTVFEIPAGSSVLQTAFNFQGASGANPIAGLTLGPGGQLFGTTLYGGTSGRGLVFALNPTPDYVTPTINWTNPGGGDWNNPSNWSADRVPNASDNVAINVQGNPIITFSSGNVSVNSIQCSDTLNISGGYLYASSPSQITNLNLSGGTLDGAAPLAVSGGLTWSGGTMVGTGSTVLLPTASLAIAGNVSLDRSLVAQGTGTWTAGVITLGLGGVFENQGSFTADTTAAPLISVNHGSSGEFLNDAGAIFTVTGGQALDLSQTAFSNAGTVALSAGSLKLGSGSAATDGGTFSVAPSANLLFSQGRTFAPGTTFSGDGLTTFQAEGSTFTFLGTATFTNLAVSWAEVTFNANATIQNLSVLAASGQPGGIIDGAGSVTVTKSLIWSAGTMQGTGSTIIGPGVSFSITHNVTLARLLVNDGMLNWSSGSIGFLAGAIDNEGNFAIDTSAGNLSANPLQGTTGQLTNGPSATLTASGGGAVDLSQISFNNSGSVAVNAGTLSLGGGAEGGVFSVAASASLWFDRACTFASGTDFAGAGLITFGGGGYTSTFAGAVTFDNLAVTAADLAFNSSASIQNLTVYAAPGGQGGRIDGTGTATVSGSLIWSAGFMQGSGTTAVAPGGSLTIAGNVSLDRTLENQGSATWSTGTITFNGGTLDNLGTFTADTTAGSLSAALAQDATGQISNEVSGTFHVLGSNIWIDAVPFSNTGSLDVPDATFEMTTGSLTFNGSAAFSTGPSANVVLQGGSLSGNTTNADLFKPLGGLTLYFPNNPQTLEVMSRDVGATAAGFVNNFAYGNIDISDSNTQLVDQANNSGSAAPEALYVDTLNLDSHSTLDLNGLHLYAREALLSGKVLNGAVTLVSPPAGGAMVTGTPTAGTIATSGANQDWTFYGQAGAGVTITLDPGSSSSSAPLSPQLHWAQVQLLDPGGNVIGSAQNSAADTVITLAGQTLPTTGTYTIRVQAAPAQLNSTGYYTLLLQSASVNSMQLDMGAPTSGSLQNPQQVDEWTFTGAAGEPLRLHINNASPSAAFSLIGPNGYSAFQNVTSDALATLPVSGSYTLIVRSTNSAPGSYSFTLSDTAASQFSPGMAVTGTLTGTGQAILYQISLPQAQALFLSLQDTSPGDADELYASFGAPPTRTTHDYSAGAGSASPILLIPRANSGTWYVLVYGAQVPQPSSFSLAATTASLMVTRVTPSQYISAAPLTMTISGAGFDGHTTISLIAPDSTVYAPASISDDSFTQITATFSPGSLPAGVYSLQVTRGDGTSTLIGAALTITGDPIATGYDSRFQTHLIVPADVGIHSPGTLYVQYYNGSNAAIAAPLVIVDTDLPDYSPLLSLDGSQLARGLYDSNSPSGFASSVEFLASGVVPGILQPHETGEIPIYYAGLGAVPKGAVDVPHSITFQAKFVSAGPTQTADQLSPANILEQFPAGSLPTQLAFPSSVPPNGWLLTGDKLIQEWGAVADKASFANSSTAYLDVQIGSFVQSLDNAAAALGKLGQNIRDVGQLFGFEVATANQLAPMTALAGNTDLSVPTPALPLQFSRTYSATLTGVSYIGQFFDGWSTNWDISRTTDSHGDVFIFEPGGLSREFQPDSRGGYFSSPGDNGILTQLTGGGFSLREPSGIVTTFLPSGKLNSVADANGNTITAAYNSAGQMTSLTHSSGAYIRFSYNQYGEVLTATDSLGRMVSYSYDNQHLYDTYGPVINLAGEALSVVHGSDGSQTVYGYNSQAYDAYYGSFETTLLTSIAFPNGSHQYFDWNTSTVAVPAPPPSSPGADLYFNPGYSLADVYRDNGADKIVFAENAPGEITAADANTATQYFYDANDQLAKEIDPLGNISAFTHNSLAQLTQITDPTGQTSSFTYNTLGNIISSTDALRNTTTFIYGTTTDQLISYTDANGNTTRYNYDGSGNLLAITYPDSSTQRWAFDPLGDPISFVNARGHRTGCAYNSAGQITSEAFADGSSYSYAYNVRGKLASATDATGTTVFTYDPATDFLIEVAYPNGMYLKFQYNAAGQRTQMVDQTGFTTNYGYDAVGNLAGLTDGSGNPIVTYTYDPATNLLAKKVNANGTYTTYQYDADGNVTHLINYTPSGLVNSRFDYTYNVLGLRTTQTTVDGGWVYSYDADGQLVHAIFAPNSGNQDLGAQDFRYNYDAVGNRTSSVMNGVTTLYTVNNINEYTSVGGVPYAYDADGNLTSAGAETYTYNSANQAVAVAQPSALATYQYDALGRQRSNTGGGTTTQLLDDPLGHIVQMTSGATSMHYLWGLGIVAAEDTAGDTEFYDFDASGNAAGITGSAGSYVTRSSFAPFGAETYPTAPQGFGFAGQVGVRQISSTTSLAGFRMYSTTLGRFMSRDPLGLNGGASNLYQYADNSPATANDSSGESWSTIAKGVFNTGGLWTIAKGVLGTGGPLEFAGGELGAALGTAYLSELGGEVGFLLGTPLGPVGQMIGIILGVRFGGAILGGWVGGWLGSKADKLIDGGLGSIAPPGDYTGFPTPSPGPSPAPEVGPPAEIPDLPTPPGGNLGDQQPSQIPEAKDPNDKTGPRGYGPSNFVALKSPLPYRIDFENDPTATAPAQEIMVTDQLNSNLDWSTFQLSGFGFGDTAIAVPPGAQQYDATVPMVYNGVTISVKVDAGINLSTGVVTAHFQSLDPYTDLPPSVLIGFLPPEDGSGRGQGYVSYTILPRQNLPTGTQIRNVANISFDGQAPIETDQVSDTDPSKGVDPTRQDLVTIDAVAPTSSIQKLPATEASASFVLDWTGQDDPGGSGMGSYNIFVSDNGAPPIQWLSNTTQTTATFTGLGGHTYTFYSQAIDNAGNREPAHAVADATTMVVLHPPPTISSFVVGDGSAQRSIVKSISLSFNEPVTLAAGAITLQTSGGTSVPFQLSTADNQTYVLSFSGSQFVNGSLADGRYALVVHSSEVGDGFGDTMAADQSFNFFRLFGNYLGTGTVNNADYLRFKQAYLSSVGGPKFNAAFDYDGNGIINNADFLHFKKRYLTTI